MGFIFQAHKSGDPKGKEVSLLLAERMVNNFVKDGKIEAEAEVMTYLHILETQVIIIFPDYMGIVFIWLCIAATANLYLLRFFC